MTTLSSDRPLLLIDGWTVTDAAKGYGVPRSTVIRWRAKGHEFYKEWCDNPAHSRLPHNALSRQVLKLWRAGTSESDIATTLHMPRLVVWRMIKDFVKNDLGGSPSTGTATQERPAAPTGYAPGDRMRARILEAITALTQLKGEAPTGREIQAEIGARSKIDYHLTQMKTQGIIRMANGGRGYEVVSPELISRSKFRQTR